MKTQLTRLVLVGAASSVLLFCVGCAEGKLQADTLVFATDIPVPTVAEDKPATPATPLPDTNRAPTDPVPALANNNDAGPALERTNAPPSTNATGKALARVVQPPITPTNLNLTPALQEIVKLAQAGVSDDVMLAYITNSSKIFNIGSDEIVYLNDLGVAPHVVTALIQFDTGPETASRRQALMAVKPLPPGVARTTPATNVYPPRANMTPPVPPEPDLATEPVVPPPTDGQTVMTAPTEEVTVSYFYDNLSPYGNWVDVPDYGHCWQPTVAISNPSWRPYSDNGCWLWSDSGWYWHSYYSWGWAPFHYGRWCSYPRVGWLWVPDTRWGPSWVSWRYNKYHCGWAPLPPRCDYVSGFGLSYHGGAVGVSFDFGLATDCYTYVPLNRFCERNLHHYSLSRSHAATVHKESTVINNYIGGNNNTIINNGIGRERVAKVTRAEIPHVRIREVAPPRGPTRAELIQKSGSSLSVSSPQLPREAGGRPTDARPSGNANAGFSAPGHKALVSEERIKPGAAVPATGRAAPASGLSLATTPSSSAVEPLARNGAEGQRPAPGTSLNWTGRRTELPTRLYKSEVPRAPVVIGNQPAPASDIARVPGPTRSSPSQSGTAGNTVGRPAPTTSHLSGSNPNYNRGSATQPLPDPRASLSSRSAPNSIGSQPGAATRAQVTRSEAAPRSVGRPAPSGAPSYSAPPVRSEHRAPVAAPSPAPVYRSEPSRAAPSPPPSYSAPSRVEAPAARSQPAPSSSSGSSGGGRTGRDVGR